MTDRTAPSGATENGGEPPQTRGERRWAFWANLPLLAGLVVLWALLWGSVSWLTLVTGVIIALAVTRVFFLPIVDLPRRFHLGWALVFLGKFLPELVVASFQVALQAFLPRGIQHNGVFAVQLGTRSDFIMTMTALSVSLLPGSLVLEVDRQSSILYVHVLGAKNAAELERHRDDTLQIERLIVRAVGSKDDARRVGL